MTSITRRFVLSVVVVRVVHVDLMWRWRKENKQGERWVIGVRTERARAIYATLSRYYTPPFFWTFVWHFSVGSGGSFVQTRHTFLRRN